MLRSLFPSMFHRRLLLLGVVFSFALILPVAQMANLTLRRTTSLRAEVENRLISRQWEPARRGRILDRKGRVLAQDRPSYDVLLDYDVISGEWAFTRAAQEARSADRSRWSQLSAHERLSLVESIEPRFQLEIDRTWDTIARIAGVSRALLDARREQVVRDVHETAAAVNSQRQRTWLESLNRGRAIALDPEDAFTAPLPGLKRPKAVQVREQVQPHVILAAVDDRVGAALLGLVDSEENRAMHEADPSHPAPLAGLSVQDSDQRVYPYESVEAAIDTSSFPATLKPASALPDAPPPPHQDQTNRSSAIQRIEARGVASHLLGWMRANILDTDLLALGQTRLDDPRAADGRELANFYRFGDQAGAAGVEAADELTLRGSRGSTLRLLDTGETQRIPPTPGADTRLTLDIMLQARVQALLAPEAGLTIVQPWHRPAATADEEDNQRQLPLSTPLAAAAVVIDIDSGDVLALVSSPSFTREQVRTTPEEVFIDPVSAAHVNRAIYAAYQPGSIVKPLVLCAAWAEGEFGPGQTIACTGQFIPSNPKQFRCWIFKQFNTTHTEQLGHDLSGDDALMASCNIFFFELGKRLGPEALCRWFTRFGVGDDAPRPNFRAGPMYPGAIGQNADRSSVTSGQAILMAIGQGPIAWTPLHAADAYATLARGGVRLLPRLRMDDPSRVEPLSIPPAAIAQTLEGLRRSVTDERGTTHHITYDATDSTRVREPIFNTPGVDVWAKSGTADASAIQVVTPDGIKHTLRDGDHAWSVCLAGPAGDRPRFSIAVVVDYGGSGGKVAGPIANQIIRALIHEGYLVPAPTPAFSRSPSLPPRPAPKARHADATPAVSASPAPAGVRP